MHPTQFSQFLLTVGFHLLSENEMLHELMTSSSVPQAFYVPVISYIPLQWREEMVSTSTSLLTFHSSPTLLVSSLQTCWISGLVLGIT